MVPSLLVLHCFHVALVAWVCTLAYWPYMCGTKAIIFLFLFLFFFFFVKIRGRRERGIQLAYVVDLVSELLGVPGLLGMGDTAEELWREEGGKDVDADKENENKLAEDWEKAECWSPAKPLVDWERIFRALLELLVANKGCARVCFRSSMITSITFCCVSKSFV